MTMAAALEHGGGGRELLGGDHGCQKPQERAVAATNSTPVIAATRTPWSSNVPQVK